MNKKGFTLIELLAVVTIIALLSMLIIPNIVGNVEKKKGEISDANMKLLASATDIYIENNRNKYANTFEASGSTYCIPVQVLINDNILETPFKDVNGEEIDYSKVMKSTYNDNYNSFDYQLVDVSECTEIVNHVNKPELYENMIPVVYKNNKWVKADINSKWYSYIDKNWANAVYVKEYKDDNIENSKSRFEYIDALPGTEIAESDILAQFVWIPRFKYQLFTNNEQTINIAFESVTTPKSNGIATNQWLTHPAFTSGNQELSGIWVAKYETSNDNSNITIKKDKTPWTNINYNDANQISYDMSNEGNIYGITKNTHLIKNSEWSAVAYLTNSVYGINQKLETNSSTTTGNTNSTTGNNTGIYDMSGLSSEFVMNNLSERDLSETSNWYGENNIYPNTANLWIKRGETSIFNFKNSTGGATNNTSFRVAITLSNQKEIPFRPNIVTTGDGLYVSTLDQGKYIYRGSNPNNYLILKENNVDTLYRIISYEEDGTIKVIRNESIGNMSWDARTSETTGHRKNSENSYCDYLASGYYYGCNAWGNQNNTYYKGELLNTLSNSFYYKYYLNNTTNVLNQNRTNETVITDSTLNTYLNGTWLTNTQIDDYIIEHSFDVGGIYYYNGYTGGDKGLVKEKQEQGLNTWHGKVGLFNITDMVEASLSTSCTSVWSNYRYNPDNLLDDLDENGNKKVKYTLGNWPCALNNWLFRNITEWTLSPYSINRNHVWNVNSAGYFDNNGAYGTFGVRPSFLLKSSTVLSGDGTASNPYKIVSN